MRTSNTLIINTFLTLILVIFLLFYLESMSSAIFYCLAGVSFFIFGLQRKGDMLLGFNLIACFTIFFYIYWSNFGTHYFQGMESDDWKYDEVWSKDFYTSYGLNYFKIRETRSIGILHNSPGYVYVIALLRRFGEFFDGYHTMLPRLLNCLVLVHLSYLVYKTLILYKVNEKIAVHYFYLLILYPVVVFNSVHVFRDTLVAFLIFLFFFELAFKKKNIRTVVIVLIILLLLSQIRMQMIFILIGLLPLFLLSKEFLMKRSLIIGVVLIFAILAYSSLDDRIFQMLNSYDELNTERMGGIGAQIFSMPKWIGWLPRISFLVLTPVPSLGSFYQFYTSLSAFIQVIFFPVLIYALINKAIDFRLRVFFIVLFMGVALSTATFRHVQMYIPIAFTLVAIQKGDGSIGFKSRTYLKFFLLSALFIILSMSLALIF